MVLSLKALPFGAGGYGRSKGRKFGVCARRFEGYMFLFLVFWAWLSG